MIFMRSMALLMITTIFFAPLAGCVSETINENPTGTDCYSQMYNNELAGESTTTDIMSILSVCATVELSIDVDGETVYQGSTMVGLQSEEADVLMLQLNNTSSVKTSFDIMTYSSFSIITLNETEYSLYLDGYEYIEIPNLSSLCFDFSSDNYPGCEFDFELDAGIYYMIMIVS